MNTKIKTNIYTVADLRNDLKEFDDDAPVVMRLRSVGGDLCVAPQTVEIDVDTDDDTVYVSTDISN
jgi:hypothetical protein